LKIIVDTNVLISGIFFSGPPYQILKLWHERKFQLVISLEIFEEYKRVSEILSKEFPEIEVDPILNFIIKNAEIISTDNLSEPICEDPDDDKFIACAITCKSKVIVSGDKHLLKISGYQEIEVITPREFLNRFQNL
jgi:putative PIN family toxin of toxin-antitoxin system